MKPVEGRPHRVNRTAQELLPLNNTLERPETSSSPLGREWSSFLITYAELRQSRAARRSRR